MEILEVVFLGELCLSAEGEELFSELSEDVVVPAPLDNVLEDPGGIVVLIALCDVGCDEAVVLVCCVAELDDPGDSGAGIDPSPLSLRM